MKKCDNIILKLLLPLLAMATSAGCSSDEGEVTGPQSWQVNIPTTQSYSATRTSLSVSGTTMSAVWNTTDEVQVFKGETSVGPVYPDAASSSATLTGTLTGTFAESNELKLYWPNNSPNYSTQDGTLDGANGISSKDYVQATVTVSEVDQSNAILLTTRAAFHHRQSFNRLTFSLPVKTVVISADGMSDITVTASAEQTGPFYVALPLEGSVEYTFNCTTNAGVTYRGTKTGSLTNGKYYITSIDIAPGIGITNSIDDWHNGTTLAEFTQEKQI